MDVASKAFVESVALIATAKNDAAIYERLVEACYYYANTNPEIDGVNEAIEAYRAAYDAYNATYVSINSDVEEAVKITVSVRANCGVDAIVDVICKKLLG